MVIAFFQQRREFFNENKSTIGKKIFEIKLLVQSTPNKEGFDFKYRKNGFFCRCKFLRFVSQICTYNFCDFTPWQTDFIL